MKMRLSAVTAGLIICCGCRQSSDDIPAYEKKAAAERSTKMELNSTAFEHGGTIPPKYTADGEDISPPLGFSGVPSETGSLVLIMDDPDAPVGTWDHWVMWNIPAGTDGISEGSEPECTRGSNSWGRLGYGGPAPPSGTHRYFFRLYALDTVLELPEGSGKRELESAMKGHIVAQAELMGKYSR